MFVFLFLVFSMLLLCSFFRLKELFQMKNGLTKSLLSFLFEIAQIWVGRTTLNEEKKEDGLTGSWGNSSYTSETLLWLSHALIILHLVTFVFTYNREQLFTTGWRATVTASKSHFSKQLLGNDLSPIGQWRFGMAWMTHSNYNRQFLLLRAQWRTSYCLWSSIQIISLILLDLAISFPFYKV